MTTSSTRSNPGTGLAFEELGEACHSEHRQVRRGREGLYKVFGQTEAGRHLLVVLA